MARIHDEKGGGWFFGGPWLGLTWHGPLRSLDRTMRDREPRMLGIYSGRAFFGLVLWRRPKGD